MTSWSSPLTSPSIVYISDDAVLACNPRLTPPLAVVRLHDVEGSAQIVRVTPMNIEHKLSPDEDDLKLCVSRLCSRDVMVYSPNICLHLALPSDFSKKTLIARSTDLLCLLADDGDSSTSVIMANWHPAKTAMAVLLTDDQRVVLMSTSSSGPSITQTVRLSEHSPSDLYVKSATMASYSLAMANEFVAFSFGRPVKLDDLHINPLMTIRANGDLYVTPVDVVNNRIFATRGPLLVTHNSDDVTLLDSLGGTSDVVDMLCVGGGTVDGGNTVVIANAQGSVFHCVLADDDTLFVRETLDLRHDDDAKFDDLNVVLYKDPLHPCRYFVTHGHSVHAVTLPWATSSDTTIVQCVLRSAPEATTLHMTMTAHARHTRCIVADGREVVHLKLPLVWVGDLCKLAGYSIGERPRQATAISEKSQMEKVDKDDATDLMDVVNKTIMPKVVVNKPTFSKTADADCETLLTSWLKVLNAEMLDRQRDAEQIVQKRQSTHSTSIAWQTRTCSDVRKRMTLIDDRLRLLVERGEKMQRTHDVMLRRCARIEEVLCARANTPPLSHAERAAVDLIDQLRARANEVIGNVRTIRREIGRVRQTQIRHRLFTGKPSMKMNTTTATGLNVSTLRDTENELNKLTELTDRLSMTATA